MEPIYNFLKTDESRDLHYIIYLPYRNSEEGEISYYPYTVYAKNLSDAQEKACKMNSEDDIFKSLVEINNKLFDVEIIEGIEYVKEYSYLEQRLVKNYVSSKLEKIVKKIRLFCEKSNDIITNYSSNGSNFLAEMSDRNHLAEESIEKKDCIKHNYVYFPFKANYSTRRYQSGEMCVICGDIKWDEPDNSDEDNSFTFMESEKDWTK